LARGGATKDEKTIVIIFLVATVLMIWGCEPAKRRAVGLGHREVSLTSKRTGKNVLIKRRKKQKNKENFDLLVSKVYAVKGVLFWKKSDEDNSHMEPKSGQYFLPPTINS